jgi:hypothetical protein
MPGVGVKFDSEGCAHLQEQCTLYDADGRLRRDARAGHGESTSSIGPCAIGIVFGSSQDSSLGVSEVESSDARTSTWPPIKQHHATPSPTSPWIPTAQPAPRQLQSSESSTITMHIPRNNPSSEINWLHRRLADVGCWGLKS